MIAHVEQLLARPRTGGGEQAASGRLVKEPRSHLG
jgi:hypothetical protein